jgi:hypothetical protein
MNRPKIKNYLNQALKIKNTPESRWLLEMVEKKQKEKENMIRDRLQIQEMKGDCQKLQADLKGSAPRPGLFKYL